MLLLPWKTVLRRLQGFLLTSAHIIIMLQRPHSPIALTPVAMTRSLQQPEIQRLTSIAFCAIARQARETAAVAAASAACARYWISSEGCAQVPLVIQETNVVAAVRN